MAWPSPLYVTKSNETVLTIIGAKYRATVLEEDINIGQYYQDDPVALLALQSQVNADSSDTNTGSGLAVYSGNAKAINGAGTPSSTPADYASDVVTHTMRQRMVDKSKYVWYDSPVLVRGDVTTTDTSATLTMGSTVGLIVGMAVAGTGIPVGSTIVSINANGTTFVISQPCTASATVTGTFTGNIVGDCWVVDYVDASATMPVYLS